MTKHSAWKKALAIFLLCAATAIGAPAQTFTTVHTFERADGGGPLYGSLVQGADGMGWGTTSYGGAYGGGTVFRMAQDGALTTIYNFCAQSPCPDGESPDAGLALGTDGDFYGTTSAGGKSSAGIVFKITPRGVLTALHSFCLQPNCADGAFPYVGLLQAADGSFYGTTSEGGSANQGTVFRLTREGVFTTLYSFCSQPGCADGGFPAGVLVQATDGNFYGTTQVGGANLCLGAGCGTIFRITSLGKFNTLYNFDGGTDGANPTGTLIQATDGNLYGTTYEPGTIFRISLNGLLTTLNALPYPLAGVIQGTDGNFYGTTEGGGNSNNCQGGCGTLFEVTPGGTLTTLHSFDDTDGQAPTAGLTQATNGVFYGTTFEGGSLTCNYPYGCGTIFSLDTGFGPFVAFVHAEGKVGQTGGILGQGLTGTTGVSLNGTPATFKVVSDTFIRATVPPGATTGYVAVATPSGTLTSNVPFHVIP